MNRITSILLVLIFAQAALLCSRETSAAIYKVSVTKYPQEKTNWCWAACTQMLGKYYYKNMSQTTICKKTMKQVVDIWADAGQTVVALQHATNRHVVWKGKQKLGVLVNEIKEKRPFVMEMKWDNNKFSHLYVISGARLNVKGKSDALYMIDPAPKVSQQYVNYRNLVNGVTLKSGTGKYKSTYFVTNHGKDW